MPGDDTPTVDTRFFDAPILNSPYAYPDRHWELDERGQPTQAILDKRRPAQFFTPIPIINDLRKQADAWRAIPNPIHWGVTPETQRLLQVRGPRRSALT